MNSGCARPDIAACRHPVRRIGRPVELATPFHTSRKRLRYPRSARHTVGTSSREMRRSVRKTSAHLDFALGTGDRSCTLPRPHRVGDGSFESVERQPIRVNRRGMMQDPVTTGFSATGRPRVTARASSTRCYSGGVSYEGYCSTRCSSTRAGWAIHTAPMATTAAIAAAAKAVV